MRKLSLNVLPALLFSLAISTPQSITNSGQSATNFDGVIKQSPVQGMREAYLPTIFASSHAANLLQLSNGDVLCFWFSGTWEGASGVAIVMSRLPAGANRWSEPIVVDQETGKSFQNPVGFEASPTDLWVLHTSQNADAGQANAVVMLVKSHDNGMTWGRPTILFDKPGSFLRQPLLAISKSKWILPMYVTPSRGITTGAESNYSVTQITTDSGRTWKECNMAKTNGLVQPSVLKLKNGQYVAFFRSRSSDWIYRSTSTDGCAWSDPQPTVLPNNNSSIQATELRNGDIAIAFNNVQSEVVKGKPQTAARKPLTVAISRDEGITWPWARDIETGRPGVGENGHLPDKVGREEYSYPSILQARDGNLDVAFTYRRATIKYVTFEEDWIKQGTTAGTYKRNGKVNASVEK